MALALQVTLNMPFDEAITQVTAALKEEGFGVATTLAMDEIFDEKLGKAYRPYHILGVCNPALAYRALEADPLVGLLLPCNVTVEAVEGGVRVMFVNPEEALSIGTLASNPEVRAVAADARRRLERVALALGSKAPAMGGVA